LENVKQDEPATRGHQVLSGTEWRTMAWPGARDMLAGMVIRPSDRHLLKLFDLDEIVMRRKSSVALDRWRWICLVLALAAVAALVFGLLVGAGIRPMIGGYNHESPIFHRIENDRRGAGQPAILKRDIGNAVFASAISGGLAK
jgi:hypothetical protein